MNGKYFSFNVFGYPVRVDLMFFLLAAFLVGNRSHPPDILIGVLVIFASVLVHEMGHAVVGRQFGLDPRIELHGRGGSTWWSSSRPLSYRQDFLISFAGPGAGLALAALALLIFRYVPVQHVPAQLYGRLMFDLISINLIWSIFNLIPMLPFDGGNLMRIVVKKIRGPYEERLPLQISIGFGALLFLWALSKRSLWGLVLIGWFTYRNYQELRRVSG